MISINPNLLIACIACLVVLIGLFLWSWQMWISVSRHWETSEDQICHCTNCQTTGFRCSVSGMWRRGFFQTPEASEASKILSKGRHGNA